MGQLNKLAQGHFFSEELREYITELQNVVRSLREAEPTSIAATSELKQLVTESIWKATQYLAGSTSNRIPYEIVFCLKHALEDWQLHNCIITTSLLKSPEFHCESVDAAPAQRCATLALKANFQVEPVQIAFPEIFEHSPIFCSPLYHELGHYVEERLPRIKGIYVEERHTEGGQFSLLPDRLNLPMHLDERSQRDIFTNHSIEHFCDLFAASYTGECAAFYLEEWSSLQGSTLTHPSTFSRTELIRDFLAGRHNEYIQLLVDKTRDLETGETMLKKRFILPDVASHFTDVRPCEIQSIEELHGIFPAALAFMKAPMFLAEASQQKVFRSKQEVPILVNDLTEKSIRNFMIKRTWNEHLDENKN